MANLQTRSRFSTVGLGKLQSREIYPGSDAAYANLGTLDEEGSEVQDVVEPSIIKDETGKIQNVLFDTIGSRFVTNLKQVGIDEWNYISNAITKRHSIRYSGMANSEMFQYFCFEQGQIIPKTDRKFNKDQKLPFEFVGINKDTSGFTTPNYHLAEAKAKIRTDNLMLWCNPRNPTTPELGTAKVFDISGFARHGDLNSDFATIWKTGSNPDSYLQFDGVNDQADFGDTLNDDGVSDLLHESWIKILAADGSTQVVFAKKNSPLDTTVGYALTRNGADNRMYFKISNGTTAVEVFSPATVLQNVWKHIAVAIDRNGTGQIYINGAPSGAGSSVATVPTATNTLSLYLSRSTSGTFANIQQGCLRVYNFGAGGLPSDIATIISNHYNAEKSYYGL